MRTFRYAKLFHQFSILILRSSSAYLNDPQWFTLAPGVKFELKRFKKIFGHEFIDITHINFNFDKVPSEWWMDVIRTAHFPRHYQQALMKIDVIPYGDPADRTVDYGHRSPTAQHFMVNGFNIRFATISLPMYRPHEVADWPEGLVPIRVCDDDRCLAAGHVVFAKPRQGAAARLCKRIGNCTHDPKCVIHGSGKFFI